MDFSELTGKVVTPYDKEYPFLRLVYNRAINKFPIALVYCYSSFDVSNAIKWCRKNNIEPRIRTGGHNYEGYCTANGLLVIDTTYMNNVYIDTKKDIAKIDSGTKLWKVYSSLAKEGYGFAGGTCPTVGISGLVLGGGIGLSSRLLGLTSDNLLSLDLINSKGNLIRADKKINSDLFWACNGAGAGNFGVATSYTFKVYKVRKITVIQLRWDNTSRSEFMELWQKWLKTADDRISCFAGLNKEGIYLNAFFYGYEYEAEEILKDFLMLPNLLEESSIKYVPFIDAVKDIGSFYGPPNSFKATGRFVYRPLSKENINRLIDYIDSSPEGAICNIRLYTLGGAVKKVPIDASAYFYRNSSYILGITADWEKDIRKGLYVNWVNQVFNYVQPLTRGSYVNFPYSELKNYGYEYWGKNYCKLREVKSKYDPDNFFRYQQSIEPY